MPLESTMICLDNSDWMRNGDYPPSRLDAQQDAAILLCNDRLNNNAESTVGLLTMAGQGVNMLASPTEELPKVLACFARLKLGGKSDLITSIQIAQLALKHRKNKNGGQRIVAFIGCPLSEPVEVLTKIGKQLKKNNVAIDLISVGESEENVAKLQELVNAANTNDNSRLIVVPVGVSPVNALRNSPILHSSSMGGMGSDTNLGGGGDNFEMYGGVDPSVDPEYAMVLRLSAETARMEEEARMKAAQESSGDAAAPAISSSSGANAVNGNEDDEEEVMRRALAMSMLDANAGAVPDLLIGDYDEDAELQRALALSMNAEPSLPPAAAAPTTSSTSQPSSLEQLDQNDPLVQAALQQLQEQEKKQQEDQNKKRKNDER